MNNMTFSTFAGIMNQHIENMTKEADVLFQLNVDKDELWNTWNDSFPRGTNEIFRVRREYDCSCCHSFIKHMGNVVVITPELEVKTIFDFEVSDPKYNTVLKAMRDYLAGKEILDIFVAKPTLYKFGQKTTKELVNDKIKTWSHMWFDVPRKFQSNDPAERMGQYRDTKNVFKRSLTEISEDAIDVVLEISRDGALYRGEQYESALNRFKNSMNQYKNIPDNKKDLYCWLAAGTIGSDVGRIRNTLIGTLLTDLTEGKDLDTAVKSYESKAAPENYKRPKALYTKRMLDDAQKGLTEMGYLDSLRRRFAKLDDVNVNDILFVNRDAAKRMKGGNNIFDEMANSIAIDPKKFNKVEEMSIDKFLADVLPTAKNIELFFENKITRNLVSLIAPEVPDAPSMFKWNNPFCWAYSGNVTDTFNIKENVKAAGGQILADLRFSIQWNDDPSSYNRDDYDAHCVETINRKTFEIYYADKHSDLTCGQLDIDITNPLKDEVAVENIFYPKKKDIPDGTYKFRVHNFANRGGKTGFKAEIEMLGEIFTYEYPHELHNKQIVDVATVTVKNGEFSIVHHLNSSQHSKTVWNMNTQQFIPVTTIMASPNYWEGEKGVGHKHYFFMLDGAVNDENPNGFYNEFLVSDLDKYKRVMAALGNKLSVVNEDDQLSGVGFAVTTSADNDKRSVILKVTGKATTRTIKVTF